MKAWSRCLVGLFCLCLSGSLACERTPQAPEHKKARSLKDLARALRSPSPGKRVEAVLTLATRGVEAMPLMVQTLQSHDPRLRWQAILWLQKQGVKAAGPLLKATFHFDPKIRMRAGFALSRLGKKLHSHREILLLALEKAKDPAVRVYLGKALCQIGRPVEAKLQALLLQYAQLAPLQASTQPTTKVSTGPSSRHTPKLKRLFQRWLSRSRQTDAWNEIFRTLQCIGTATPSYLDALGHIATRAPAARSLKAMSHLLSLGPLAEKPWRFVLQRADDTRRMQALDLLNSKRPFRSKRLDQQIFPMLRSPSPELRWQAARYFGLAPGASFAIPALKQATQDSDPRVQHAALVALTRRKVPPKALHAVITAHLQSTHPVARAGALVAIGLLAKQAPKGLETLLTSTKDPARVVREAAASSLGAYASEGHKGAVLALLYLLKDKATQVRQEAIRSLGKANISQDIIVRVLAVLLRDPQASIRRSTADALGALKLQAAPALSTLRKATSNESDLLTRQAMETALQTITRALSQTP